MDKPSSLAAAGLAAAMIWGWTGGAAADDIVAVALQGETAPGTGSTFSLLANRGPAVNAAGQVAFKALFNGNAASGIWLGRPGDLALVAKTADTAPGAEPDTFLVLSDRPYLNRVGQVAFLASLNGGDEGIWVGRPGNLALVALTGRNAPGTSGLTFADLSFDISAGLNSTGEVLFMARLAGTGVTPGVNDIGIWAGAPGSVAMVARTGDQAPGAGGATFDNLSFSFTRPVINGAGQVAFNSDLSGGGEGIWLGRPGSLSLVVRDGDPAPDTGGEVFGDFLRPTVNTAGDVAFLTSISGGGAGIWRGRPGDLSLAALRRGPAPDTSGEILAGMFNTTLSGANDLAFMGAILGGDNALWVGRPDALSLVMREGDQAPGAGGETFDFSTFRQPSVNGAGEVLFRVTLSDASEGIWAGAPGRLRFVAREGSTIEVAPGDVRTIADFGLALADGSGNEDGQRSGLSEGGQVAFAARFTDSSSGVFLAPPPDTPEIHLMSQQSVDGGWRTIYLPRGFVGPVVIVGPPSFQDRAPGVARLREVGGTSFQVRFQEWAYLDGTHSAERLDFIVMERGRHTMADGSVWEAGVLELKGNGRWKRKTFARRFPRMPKVFLTVQSLRDRTPVAVRARNVSRTAFEVALFEEEKLLRGKHKRETVGYLAIFSAPNRGTIAVGVDGTAYRLKQRRMDHKFKTVLGAEFKLEEERSKDKERRHEKEKVAVMRLGRGFFAQQATDKEVDTTAIRRR